MFHVSTKHEDPLNQVRKKKVLQIKEIFSADNCTPGCLSLSYSNYWQLLILNTDYCMDNWFPFKYPSNEASNEGFFYRTEATAAEML